MNLDKLETRDTDKKALHKKLFKEKFANKYKTYYKKDLQQFLYEVILGKATLPSVDEMKKWNGDRKLNLQIVDEYLE